MYRQALRIHFFLIDSTGSFKKLLISLMWLTLKTKDLVTKLKGLIPRSSRGTTPGRVLIIIDGEEQNLWFAAGNIPHVSISELNYMDPVSLVAYDQVLLTVDVLKKIEEKLS